MENVKMWVSDQTPIESQAYAQIKAMAQLPILAGHIAIMPDVHWGKGATVGSVIPTRGAIIPAAVGVDLGCGMAALQTSMRIEQLPDNLADWRSAIEAAIPVGFNAHDNERMLDKVLQLGTHTPFEAKLRALRERFNGLALHAQIPHNPRHKTEAVAWKQIGTLGGGNHFIEVQTGDDGYVWLMLHSGSRNVGKTLAEVAISQARQEAETRGDVLPDKDLAWLAEGSGAFHAYLTALWWAQDYARMNREAMLALLWNALILFLPDGTTVTQTVNCHHNYVEQFGEGVYVTRKGAVSAREGEYGIVPGSMGTASYIVRGKGNPDSYYSCSHGAGRRMSRNQAKKQFTVDDLIAQTAGVESRKDSAVIDEIPAAYKDVDAVIAAQADLIEPVVRLKQVLCVKAKFTPQSSHKARLTRSFPGRCRPFLVKGDPDDLTDSASPPIGATAERLSQRARPLPGTHAGRILSQS
ncbi:RtcB family protein [Sulfobacillus harzensis]|uniref:3'-phosphate/5'-hydroxy nucleic acid ligase n=1 Tax=Sulfobacillus harzensis TaxID=2729629 RepID=A0A7Y0L7A4_9FIRM|nr:RtcB family protein [Sulfobacillus harzensis]NMP24623.1 RtcB family protein [Sulfobacillus harzensis]